MSFAKSMQAVASKLLSQFDESDGRIVLIRKGGAVWDPVLAEMVQSPDVEIKMTGVTVAYSEQMVNGTTIQAGDVQVIASVVDGGISPQDKIKIDGALWSIVGVPMVDYTGLTLCHKIQCRR